MRRHPYHPAWVERERRFEQRRVALDDLVVSAYAEPGKLLEERRRRVELSRPTDKLAEKAFVEVWSRSFLGVETRDRTCQSGFREELIQTYNSRHPGDDSMWCPVITLRHSRLCPTFSLKRSTFIHQTQEDPFNSRT